MENFRFIRESEAMEGYEECLNSEDSKFLFETEGQKVVKRVNKKPMLAIGDVMQKLMKTKQESIIKKKSLIAQLLKDNPGNRIPLIETLLESGLSLTEFRTKIEENNLEPEQQREEPIEELIEEPIEEPIEELNEFGDDDSMFANPENTAMLGGAKIEELEPEPEEPKSEEPVNTQNLADLVANKTLSHLRKTPITVNLEEGELDSAVEELKSFINNKPTNEGNQQVQIENLRDKLTHIEGELERGFGGIFEKFSKEEPKVTSNFLELEIPISDRERELINQYQKSEGLIGFIKTKAFEGKQETTVTKNGVNLIEGADKVIEGASLGLFEFISIHFPFVLLEYQQQIKERL